MPPEAPAKPGMDDAPPQPAWPLLLVAGLSFIPGFGFVFGAIAVTWGLLTRRRPRKKLAIILGATGAALTIAESALLLYVFTRDPMFAEARLELVRGDLSEVAAALENHKARTGGYPRGLTELTRSNRMLNITDRSASLFSTQPYQYQLQPDGRYRLFAVGADGRPNTADDLQLPPRRGGDTTAVSPER